MQPTFRHARLAAVLLSVAFTVHAKTASEVYEQAARSTVVVENIDAQGKAQSMGSGVILPDGDVVTNCHVVKGANRLKVRIGPKEHPATLRYSDWDRDVCSLSVAGLSAPAVVVGSSKTLKVGAKVYAIGAPRVLNSHSRTVLFPACAKSRVASTFRPPPPSRPAPAVADCSMRTAPWWG